MKTEESSGKCTQAIKMICLGEMDKGEGGKRMETKSDGRRTGQSVINHGFLSEGLTMDSELGASSPSPERQSC